MAKDGTMRGGQRVGAGRKPNALVDKVNAGMEAMVMDLPDPDPLVGEDMPPVKEYMKSEQQIGIPLCAEEVFKDTWNWLKKASDNQGGNRIAIYFYGTDLYEAGQHYLVSNLPSGEREQHDRL